MLDHHHRYLAALGDASDHLANGTRAIGIEVRGRLVEEQHPRSEREDPGDGEALLFAAGKRRGRVVLAVGEPDVRERAVDARPDLVRRYAAVLEPECDVVTGARHDELGFRILQDEAGVATDRKLALLVRSAAPIEQAGESLKERALPRAGRSY